jgi:hypothetical protein
MKKILAVAGALLLIDATAGFAHRLDEFLQATTIAVGRDRIEAQIRLAPGVAVVPRLLAVIDANGDGAVSAAEEREYAERVLRDVALSVDGDRLQLRLVSWTYPTLEELREGRGEIRLEIDAAVPLGDRDRRLTFANHHMREIAAYLVNGLVPRAPDVRVMEQSRNYEQSTYEMTYQQAGTEPSSRMLAGWLDVRVWLGVAVLLSIASIVSLRRRAGPGRVVAG